MKTFIHSHSSLENPPPDSRPKWAKSIPAFRTKRGKTPTLWDGTNLDGLYSTPPGGFGTRFFVWRTRGYGKRSNTGAFL